MFIDMEGDMNEYRNKHYQHVVDDLVHDYVEKMEMLGDDDEQTIRARDDLVRYVTAETKENIHRSN